MKNNKKLLEIKRARLKMYLEAEKAILSSQSYEIEGLKLTRADLAEVRKAITKLEDEVAKFSGGRGVRFRRAVPVDR
jgi:hypothetical protein